MPRAPNIILCVPDIAKVARVSKAVNVRLWSILGFGYVDNSGQPNELFS